MNFGAQHQKNQHKNSDHEADDRYGRSIDHLRCLFSVKC
jgi:hypothetical protein